MEQSVNTFSKGLQLDTSPMVLGNDTLSDALNATFVTMNGNEVILQNDMGNRKVDNAYLPNGYEPVGIKEYGGIIYIAAYNPITNRSLIGSFPSPERRISLADDENLGGTLNLGIGDDFIFKEETDSNLGGLHVLKNDTALIPLTKDTSLHAGDKFIVYSVTDNNNSDSVFTNRDDITNYNNIITEDEDDEGLRQHIGKIISPKNRRYTLSLGILNSQNEFVDITNSLVRWKNDGTLIDTSNMTELLKFNSGYFIRNSSSDPWESLTIKDEILEGERENAYLIMEANTYAYKLVGPLYLLAKLNHILDFSYNIYGTYSNGELELYIEGYITYNCPDGAGDSGGGDDTYYKYDTGDTPNLIKFDFLYKNSDTYIRHTNSSDDISFPEYDPITNLYSVKITKYLILTTTNISGLDSDSTIDYIIGVRAINNQVGGNYIYLSGLSDKGTIDVSKLGSGEISLKGWRFHNNYEKKKGTITLNLEAYPKYGEIFGDLEIKFTNAINGGNFVYHTIPVRNGKINIDITWASPEEPLLFNKFWDRALYKVTFYRGLREGENSNTDGYDEGLLLIQILNPEFYLTTELFNECYIPGNPKFVADFGDTTNTYLYAYIEEKLNIKYDIEYEILDESKLLDPEIDSQIFVPKAVDNATQQKPYITYTNKYMLNFYIKANIKFNKELYPSYIIPQSLIPIETELGNDNFDINSNITYNIGNNFNPNNFDIIFTNNDKLYTKSNMLDGRIKISKSVFNYQDKFIANAINKILTNIYVPIDDTVISHFFDNMTCCGVTIDWGKSNTHYLRSTVINMNLTPGECGRSPYNRDTGHLRALPEQTTFKDESTGGTQNFYFSESLIGNLVLTDFTARSTKSTIFTWLFGYDYNNPSNVPEEYNGLYSGNSTFEASFYAIGNKENTINTLNNYYWRCRNAGKKARLWWKTFDNSWALVDYLLWYPNQTNYDVISLPNAPSIATQIALLFKNGAGQYDLYFCHYKEISSDSTAFGNKLGPDIVNYKYNNPYTINLEFSLDDISSPNTPNPVFLTNFNYYDDDRGIFVNSINPKESILKFKADPITGGCVDYNITINSNSTFLDYVDSVLTSTISNISDLGTTKDRDNNPLRPNRIYRKNSNGLLELLSDINIYVDEDYSADFRSILYKGHTYSTANRRYDICSSGGEGNVTRLDFDSVNIVRNIQ